MKKTVSFTPRYLSAVEQDGVPARLLVDELERIGRNGWQPMSPAMSGKLDNVKEVLRQRAKNIETLLPKIEKVISQMMKISVSRDDLPQPIQRPSPYFSGEPFDALHRMGALGKEMKKVADYFGSYLRTNGRADQGIDFIVGWILICNPRFKQWQPLSYLIVEALLAAGVEEKETYRIDGEWLRKIVKPRVAPMIRSVFKGEGTCPTRQELSRSPYPRRRSAKRARQ